MKTIRTIACLGTGTMGHGVAFLAAKAGNHVRMFGRSGQSIKRGMDSIDRAIKLYEDNALMPRGSGAEIKAHITGFTGIAEAVAGVDMVMESVSEDMRIKHEVYKEAEKHCPAEAILATDTSSLTLSAIAAVLKKPERFCAVHFFTPPYLMPTVEVCPCPDTLPAVIATAAAWVEDIGNVPIVMNKEVPGFLINRIQSACVREALYIVEQGWASPETVDKAISYCLGRRYSATGPVESADMGGLDIFDAILDELGDKLYAGKSLKLLKDAVKRGELGLKSGKGIYDWPPERVQERRSRREQALIEFIRRDQAERTTAKGKKS
ncbi:MAG: 3-hydroxyacyl-CoA dehydrogenase family protein [Deltaproteobacteria bacterium]|nr:3-hydroxyacyl-CoA dehydrogenase family protein [Deltaproteobacteria bacterium]